MVIIFFQSRLQTYDGRAGRNNGIKQVSDPGIFPGMPGKNPFLFPSERRNQILRIFRIKTNHMIIKPYLFRVFFLSIGTFISLRGFTNNSNHFATAKRYLTAPAIKSDTGGRAVNLDSAQACIDRFAGLMKDHGFADQAGLPIDIHLTTTSMITTGESFNGKDLLNWLSATSQQFKAANKKLMIRVQMGVYDLNYLNTYQPNNTANNNRIAIFLIPYDGGTGKVVKNLIAVPNGSGGTQQGGSGYDLGGLQP
jgi:hypothetical protein